MESPVVVDKPPEYHGNGNNERGFPFDEEESSGAWSQLAARYPDIAARLRQRPPAWARKRRPSSQDAADDFGDDFSGFDRFPFEDIPPEFREHFPSHWNRRFNSREEPQQHPQQQQAGPASQQQTTATQTDSDLQPTEQEQTPIPQYGLRNTVDLGQKSPTDPVIDAEERAHRSVSAPPDTPTVNQNTSKMSGQNHHDQPQTQQEHPSNVRHIPIFVEGRDEPVINKNVDHGTHFGETKHVPPPQPHIDREQYFADDGPVPFQHPPNFGRAFGTPFNKGYRQGPQPFVQQKMYPQTQFARGASPQRSQSPKAEEHYVKMPAHHDQPTQRPEPPSKPQAKPQQHKPAQQHQSSPPPQEAPPQPKPQPSCANDPISIILSIQTDVLNLMSEVENFSGNKKDKRYIFLDEMLTRNLLKLDNIETDGKENIRQARKEAIKCIQKCIEVLEAKADKGGNTSQSQNEMKVNSESRQEEAKENGEVEMSEVAKETNSEGIVANEQVPVATSPQAQKGEGQKLEEKNESVEIVDTRPKQSNVQDENENKEEIKSVDKVENNPSPKKGTKNIKKRDKSKDNKKEEIEKNDAKDKEDSKHKKDDNKIIKENVQDIKDKVDEKKDGEEMQVDANAKGDSQTMEVDGASASQ